MNTVTELQEALMCLQGKWGKIAKRAGVEYSTVWRLAHGKIKNPSYSVFNRVRAALRML